MGEEEVSIKNLFKGLIWVLVFCDFVIFGLGWILLWIGCVSIWCLWGRILVKKNCLRKGRKVERILVRGESKSKEFWVNEMRWIVWYVCGSFWSWMKCCVIKFVVKYC